MDVNLVLFKKNGTTKSFRLPSSVTVIGRRQESDLCIPLMIVSRRHCELNAEEGALNLRDLGSRNGTYINGQRVDQAVLQPGDNIQIGPVTFGVQIDSQPNELTVPDSIILQPPQHLGAPEKQAVDQTETFLEPADDKAGDDPAAEILNSIGDDLE
ncbi:MAG: FHA domain-containing protein [Planctomycetota bacterium]